MIIILLGLATWRITAMLLYEDGPFGVFPWIKDRVGVKYDEFSKAYGENFFSKLLSCFWCSSIWVSGLLCIYISIFMNAILSELFLYWLSASAIAIWIDSKIE